MSQFPYAVGGIIGGSGTWGARFPEDLGTDFTVVEYLAPFETPHGMTAPFKLLEIQGARILYVGMHGMYPNPREIIPPWIAAKQIAWVFSQYGVEWAITGGSVGGIQDLAGNPLSPWSIVVPDDFRMEEIPLPTADRVARSGKSEFYRLGQPFCPSLSNKLVRAARAESQEQVLEEGIYACTPLGRFETSAEVQGLKQFGAHIVGQTVGHEAVEMVNHSIHLGSLNIVSNYAENGGIWVDPQDEPNSMAEFYRSCPPLVGRIINVAVRTILDEGVRDCGCDKYVLTGLESFPVEGA
jgi:purine nucleoside phosphorylase